AFGWLLGAPSVLAAADTGLMPFNTALCFALAGAALAADVFPRASLVTRVRTGLGAAVALIAGFVLLEHLFNPPFTIDLPELHRSTDDDITHPGRMSLPTTLALLFAAVVLTWMDRVRHIASGLAVQGLTIGIFVLGFVGFGGRVVGLPLMYPESAFARMALQSAIGLMVLAIALWLAWLRMDWYRRRALIGTEEQRIILAGSAVLALIVGISVLSGFALMARQL